MTAADRARGTAAKFSSRTPAPAPAEGPDPVEAAAVEARATRAALTRRVRKTVDLTPARHRALSRWADDAAIELGVARVTVQDTLDGLVGLLVTDETLSRRLVAEIRRETGA